MAETTTSRLIRAPRAAVYRAVADVETLASCLQPANTSAQILERDPARGWLRMAISHAPGPEGTRRFHLTLLEAQPDERVVYGSAFETDDPQLAGEMKLHFLLAGAPGGTEVTVRHEGVPPAINLADNEAGTASSLANLARLLERHTA